VRVPSACSRISAHARQVDGIYFNIHRAILAQSCGLIKDMLALSGEGKAPQCEGSSVEHAVPVHNVAFHDFEIVLRDAYGRSDTFIARFGRYIVN